MTDRAEYPGQHRVRIVGESSEHDASSFILTPLCVLQQNKEGRLRWLWLVEQYQKPVLFLTMNQHTLLGVFSLSLVLENYISRITVEHIPTFSLYKKTYLLRCSKILSKPR